MTGSFNRRDVLKTAAAGVAAAAGAATFPMPALAQNADPRVVVVGGGFAGATCARMLKRLDPRIAVTLVEANQTFTACPFSNEVIAGLRDLKEQQFGYNKIADDKVVTAFDQASAVDTQGRMVTLAGGTRLPYDRLVLAPGIDLRWDSVPGYTEAAAERMPHAWKAGAQTLLLRRQLEAMPDGGLVIIAAPANPYRCPPGPYERASQIAYYLKTQRPKSKLIILDAKDAFSKQRLFQNAWKELYPGLIEWVSLSSGGKVSAVDAASMTVETDFAKYMPAVANIIPPQKAGRIAELAGVADRTGWCPVEPFGFESTLQPNIHVIGDACIAGAMPKAGFAANAQAKVCAAALVRLLAGQRPDEPRLINTCYTIVAPEYGITVAAVYRPVNGQLVEVQGAGGTSPVDAPKSTREQEAKLADGWFKTITGEIFG
jgi:sulfide dehydrogenase [flavocytochrome c] flavoprotein subunit